jgi:phosphatidate phosphatase APP1
MTKKRLFEDLFRRAELRFDDFRRFLRRRFGIVRPLEVVPYLGFGSSERLYLKGRVIEDKGISQARLQDSRWRNLVNTYKRFISDELPGARLEVCFQGARQEVVTDEKGYYSLWLEPTVGLPYRSPWLEVDITLLEPLREGHGEVRIKAPVMVPPANAQFGVISDIDDTVVQTNAVKWLRVAATVLFGNAKTRLPFKGVSAFYRALQAGPTGTGFNPLFYVSSSPWNLYDLLLEFFRVEAIPLGPLMLRNWRDSAESSLIPKEHGPFKKGEIRRILETFAGLPFILIGDSGQEDPEIYRDIVSDYPGRIMAVYIRNVSGESARSKDVAALAEKVKEAGSKLILANDTLAAAKHALGQGWICASALPSIKARKEVDESRREETVVTVVDGASDGEDDHEPVRVEKLP